MQAFEKLNTIEKKSNQTNCEKYKKEQRHITNRYKRVDFTTNHRHQKVMGILLYAFKFEDILIN